MADSYEYGTHDGAPSKLAELERKRRKQLEDEHLKWMGLVGNWDRFDDDALLETLRDTHAELKKAQVAAADWNEEWLAGMEIVKKRGLVNTWLNR